MGCFFNAAPAPVPADPVVPLRSFYRIGGQEWTGNCSMTITEVKAEPDGTQVLEGYTAAHCLTDDDGAILPIHSVAIYSEVALGARLFVHEDYPGTESGAWIAIGSYDDLLTTDVAKLRLWMPRAILIEPACKRTCDDDDDERDARVAGYPAVLQDAANRTWTEESATLPIMAVSSELPSLMLGHSLLHCADLPNDDHWGGISGGGITIANPECPSGRDLVAMVRGTFSNRVCEKRDEIIGFMGGCVPASDDIWTIYQLGLVDRLQ